MCKTIDLLPILPDGNDHRVYGDSALACQEPLITRNAPYFQGQYRQANSNAAIDLRGFLLVFNDTRYSEIYTRHSLSIYPLATHNIALLKSWRLVK